MKMIFVDSTFYSKCKDVPQKMPCEHSEGKLPAARIDLKEYDYRSSHSSRNSLEDFKGEKNC